METVGEAVLENIPGETRARETGVREASDILKAAPALRGDGSSEVVRKRQFRVPTSWTVSL